MVLEPMKIRNERIVMVYEALAIFVSILWSYHDNLQLFLIVPYFKYMHLNKGALFMNATWIVSYATVLFGVYLYHIHLDHVSVRYTIGEVWKDMELMVSMKNGVRLNV